MGIIVTVKDGVTIIDTNNVFKRSFSTGYTGVTYLENISKYRSQIYINRKTVYLGVFPTPEEAYKISVTAKEKIADGTFEEWYAERRKKSKTKPFKK